MPELPRRLLVTVLAVAAALALSRVPLPGLDLEGAEDLGVAAFSVGALGIAPWLTAWVLVEVSALATTRTRALRVGGPEDRARIARAVPWVWLVCAAAQALALVVAMEALTLGADRVVVAPGAGFRLVGAASLVAGSAIVGLAARIVGQMGLGTPFAALMLCGVVGLELDPVAALVIVVGTLAVLRAQVGGLPLAVAGVMPALVGGPPWAVVAASVGFGLWFSWPPAVAAARRVPTSALWPTLALGVAVCAAASVGLGRVGAEAVGVVVAVAIVWDLVDEARARAEVGPLEVAWPLHHVWAVGPALAALEAAGIPARARGLRFRQVVHFFGPYAPIEILVAPERVGEARRALAGDGREAA